MRRPRLSAQVLEDVLAKAERQPSGCLVFTGCRNSDGYGRLAERLDGKVVYWQAHRFVYTRKVGPIPLGLMVCHKCDNPPCIEMSHLFLGSPADNARDKTEKGRTPSGEKHAFRRRPELVRSGDRHHNARLTAERVLELRRLGSEGFSNRELAEIFKLSVTYVSEVKTGKKWRHLK